MVDNDLRGAIFLAPDSASSRLESWLFHGS